MAHFAQIDGNNKVVQVIVVPDEFEHVGEQYCAGIFGGNWKQTSYNANIRGKYAGIGDTYDPVNDIFVSPPNEQEEGS